MNAKLIASEWEVRPMIDLKIAAALIERYHYARGTANTATYLHGLFCRDAFWEIACQGVAWWIPPTLTAGTATYPPNGHGVLALSRLVIADGVPENAATFLLARSRKLIDRYVWPCLVTYADEWQGHVGTIYRADNWQYMGKTRPERTYVLDGKMIARKAGPKTRTHAEMLALGAELVGSFARHKYARFM